MKNFFNYLPLIAFILACLALFGGIFLPLIIRMSKDFWLWALA